MTIFPELKRVISRKYLGDAVAVAHLSMRDQYKNSLLGMFWSLLQPAVQIAILAVVFSVLFRVQMDSYVVYIMSGMLPWQFLVNGITRGAGSLCSRRGVFNHTVLSKSMFVAADVMTQLYTLSITLGIALAIALIQKGFSPTLLMLPVTLLPLILTTFAAAVMFAYLSAYIWDMPHVLGILFQSLIWTVPIMYPLAMVPERFRPYFEMNPLYMLIGPTQSVMYYQTMPSWTVLGGAYGVALTAIAVAFAVYRKLRRHVIYYL